VSLSYYDAGLQTGFAGPTVRTDEAGAFEVAGLALGSYQIKVAAEGYAPAEAPVRLTQPGGRQQTEVQLQPR
jgi:uncharacterized surface anchored protein